MAKQLYKNNAATTLSGTLTQGGTSFTVATGTGDSFPTITGSDYFLVTLFEKDVSGVEQRIEVVKVTGRTADTFTVERDFESMTGQVGGFAYPSVPANTVYIELRWTAYAAGNNLTSDDNLNSLTDKSVARTNLGVAIGTDVQAHDADLDWVAANITAAGKAMLDDADAAAQRTTLGLGDSATKNVGTGSTNVAAGDHLHTGTYEPAITTLGVSKGGTGVGTLTGLVKGNGTSAFSAAVAETDYVTPTGSGTLTNKTLTTPVINGFTGDTSVVNLGSGQLYKDTSGNVGIGTTTPGNLFSTAHKLAIKQDQNDITRVSLINTTVGTSAVAAYKLIGGTTNSFIDLGLADNNGTPYGAFTFGTGVTRLSLTLGGSERLRMASTGESIFYAAVQEKSNAIAASDIDMRLGNYFTKTISGTTTFTVSNVPATGTVAAFILELTNGGSATVNWFSGVKWAGGTAPTLTTSGVDILGFYTLDGGTTWRGLVLAKDSK